ncbi:Carbamoyl-phosphate synthase arginine-specific large chain [Frankliniella fusca]|uniref:Carbamoyl-phosphate synthase arginine-specific large chain n=1 Tax=Frankliniella fusca TaxID=407009 RepID=A0AAE1LU91_9NEOP|nr:Carbamoyl-phosphate synthase arginine-specific large chain [Frankliniella fusca]
MHVSSIEKELCALTEKRDCGRGGPDIEKDIKKLRGELAKAKKDLKKTEDNALRQKKAREKKKRAMETLTEEFPAAAKILKIRKTVGQPRLEENQDGLLKAISGIALAGASAAEKRRSDAVRSCRTLKELTEKVRLLGHNVSKSGVYLRLLPRNQATREGKLHVVTVPVRLCRAQSDLHRDHQDQFFCKSTMTSLDELASLLGPGQVLVMSRDDKARVLIGVVAAKLQQPLLMHMEYRVRLPDHDFPVGSSHCLVPSVYAIQEISPNKLGKTDAVSYSGPTHIVIRSGKHSSSSAATHAEDTDKMFAMESLRPYVRASDGGIKPVLILKVDGGPDENPRFYNTIRFSIHLFKKHDLDALFVACNAPGRILPHDHFGNHLGSDGSTKDEELEIRNFQHAGEVLTEIWGGMVVDGFPVTAEYVGPGEFLPEAEINDQKWYIEHVRESQYFLQVMKCENTSCCRPYRSSIRTILYQAPFPLVQDGTKLRIPEPEEHTNEKFAPLLVRQSTVMRPKHARTEELAYDTYCPSVRQVLADRKCPHCKVCFAAKKNSKQMHPTQNKETVARLRPLRILGRRPREVLCATEDESLEWIDIEDVDATNAVEVEEQDENMPLINDVAEWVRQGKIWEDAQ